MLTLVLSLGLLAAEIRLEPAVIGTCRDGAGSARVHWTADADAAPVTVHAAGVPMTGPEMATGSARTGDWVRDGLVFTLRDRAGVEIARTAAIVECGRETSPSSFLPLEAGNRWVYRVDNRQVTGAYAVEEVTAAERFDGVIYFRVEPGSRWLREDGAGRIVQRIDGADRVVFDPAAARPVGLRSTPLGDFADAVEDEVTVPLRQEFRTFAPGIGLLESRAVVLAGSSGGFSDSRTLVEAVVSGRHLREPLQSPVIAVESDRLDVSNRAVANCAVPCYFTACGLVPGADPPGTWWPCTRARIEWPGFAGAAAVSIDDDAGQPAWSRDLDLTGRPEWISIPLYERPNAPLVPGRYWIRLRSGSRETKTAIRID